VKRFASSDGPESKRSSELSSDRYRRLDLARSRSELVHARRDTSAALDERNISAFPKSGKEKRPRESGVLRSRSARLNNSHVTIRLASPRADIFPTRFTVFAMSHTYSRYNHFRDECFARDGERPIERVIERAIALAAFQCSLLPVRRGRRREANSRKDINSGRRRG